LVNNAGTTVARGKMGPPMSNMDVAEWRRLIDINLIGTVIVTKAFAVVLKEKKLGKIVNISSQAAYNPGLAMPH
jgi:3-oxoacyl-[acyl-carrier protein] reductase